MATSNDIESLKARSEARYRAAMAMADHECIRALKELLLDDHLSHVHRISAHVNLAWATDSWLQREEHRLAAEQAYSELGSLISTIIQGHEIAKRNFGDVRVVLYALAAKQRGGKPSQVFLELLWSVRSSPPATDKLQEG